MNLLRFAAGAVALAALMAPANVRGAEPVTVPAILSLTGPAAFLGKDERTALELAEKTINANGGVRGTPIHFEIVDDTSSPAVALQLLHGFTSDGRQIVIGSSIAAVCGAMAPAVADGPIDYCLSPAIHPDAGSYVFTAGVSSSDCWVAMLRYLRLKGITRIAMISTTDASGQDAEKGTLEAAKLPENAGLQFPVDAQFNPGDVSIAAEIAQIQAAHPQAVLAMTSGAALGTMLRNLVQAGIDVPVVTPYSNMSYATIAQYAAFLPKQFYFPTGLWAAHGSDLRLPAAVAAAQAAFAAAYRGMEPPESSATLAWETAMLAAAALQKLGPDARAPQIRAYFSGLRRWAGLNGMYDFTKSPQRGLTTDNVIMTRWNPDHKTWDVVSRPGGAPER